MVTICNRLLASSFASNHLANLAADLSRISSGFAFALPSRLDAVGKTQQVTYQRRKRVATFRLALILCADVCHDVLDCLLSFFAHVVLLWLTNQFQYFLFIHPLTVSATSRALTHANASGTHSKNRGSPTMWTAHHATALGNRSSLESLMCLSIALPPYFFADRTPER